MAIVYRIVQEHGGRLRVDSRPGGGTTIEVELPRRGPGPPRLRGDDRVAPEAPQARVAPEARGGSAPEPEPAAAPAATAREEAAR
jgi:hypothetical protein